MNSKRYLTDEQAKVLEEVAEAVRNMDFRFEAQEGYYAVKCSVLACFAGALIGYERIPFRAVYDTAGEVSCEILQVYKADEEIGL